MCDPVSRLIVENAIAKSNAAARITTVGLRRTRLPTSGDNGHFTQVESNHPVA